MEKVKVSARRRRRRRLDYEKTLTFSSETAELKITAKDLRRH